MFWRRDGVVMVMRSVLFWIGFKEWSLGGGVKRREEEVSARAKSMRTAGRVNRGEKSWTGNISEESLTLVR